MSRMKLIAETSPYWHYTLDYMMRSISAAGFPGMELWLASPHYCFAGAPEAMERRQEELKTLMQASGLTAPVFSPEQMVKYPWNIASPDPAMEEKSLGILSGYLDDAVALGAKMLRVGTGWQHLDRQSEKNRERSLQNLQKLAGEAQKRGLTLLIGTSGRQIGSFAWDLPSLAEYVREADRENILAAVSLPEAAEAGLPIPSCMELFGGKLGHFYLADRGGQVLGSTGDEMEGLLRSLQETGYTGYVSVQITFRDCILTPDRWLLDCAQWLRKKGFLEQ